MTSSSASLPGQTQKQQHDEDHHSSASLPPESNTNPNTNNNNNNNNPIRHSGRALVRGKIRRVWRPRYLEVWANGLVRYYEVPPPPRATTSTLDAFVDSNTGLVGPKSSSSSAAENNHHQYNNNNNELEFDDDNDQYHSKSPKSTLWIHHARIIDVTTLRDMHVGLPRGTYGFLFHGHRMDQEDVLDNLSILGGATAAAATAAAGAATDLTTLLREGSNMALGCQGNTNLNQPRDFLCAVPSLEEAQSWVVALQWAASMGKESSYHLSSTLPWAPPPSNRNNHNHNHDEDSYSWEHPEHDGFSTASSGAGSTTGLPDAPSSPTRATSVSSCSRGPPNTPNNKQTSTNTITTPTKKASGKMVVTKVAGFAIVRTDTWNWDIAYQIQVLLVMPSQQQVQEWSILRTALDLKRLVDKLSLLSTKLYKKSQLISALPQIQASVPTTTSTTTTANQTNNDFAKAFHDVDTILRSLCMEATLVNATPMKRFLGLFHRSSTPTSKHQQQPSSSPLSFWTFHEHDPTALHSTPQRIHLKKDQTTDQFARLWMQRQQTQLQTQIKHAQSLQVQMLLWYLRLPQPATTYGILALFASGVSTCVLPGVNRIISKYNLIPSISVRLDALVLSWMVAAGVGRYVLAPLVPNQGSNNKGSASVGGSLSGATEPISPSEKSFKSHGGEDDIIAQPSLATPTKSPLNNHPLPQEDVVVEEDEFDEDDEELEEEEGEDSALEATTRASYYEQQQEQQEDSHRLSSPLPQYNPKQDTTTSCWSKPKDNIFHVRGPNYLKDRIKMASAPASFTCEGVDMWLTDNPERHIARHPSVLGGKLAEMDKDMFLVNFLLPFGNFVSYFSVPPLEEFANPQLADVWTRFIQGDQQYRDARLKMLPVVVDGPWIVRAAVGPGTAPALLGKAIPLQYFFTSKNKKSSPEDPAGEEKETNGKNNNNQKQKSKEEGKNIYEVDVIITASSIAKGILSVVKGHTKALSIAFAFIIEAAEEKELPETVLCSFQVHYLNLDVCPHLPVSNLDEL